VEVACFFWEGRASLGDGGWAGSSLADLLPVTFTEQERYVPSRRGDCLADFGQGADNIITRLVEDPGGQCGALEKTSLFDGLPGSGTPKPGAVVAGGDDRSR